MGNSDLQRCNSSWLHCATIHSSLTVEHLLPQSGSLENYPYADNKLDDGFTAEEFRADAMHTVGNLTLITGPLNSSVSNGPFPRKAKDIANESDLRMNAWLRSEPPASWNERHVLKCSAELFETGKNIWPKPASAAVSV
jgi:hypothetical protein